MSEESYPLKPIAIWNNASGVWEKPEASLLCAHLVRFSATWPSWGMTLGGQAYELPMPELPIAASASLSSHTQASPDLLRTPTAVEGDGGAYSAEEKLAKGRMVMLRDQIVDLIDAPNLPTPTTQSSQRNSRGAMVEAAKRAGVQLEQAIEIANGILPREFKSWDEVPESLRITLLPTPAVAHVRNHDEPLEDYLARRADYEEGRASGMPGRSLGVAIRLEQEGIDLFPTPNTMDSLPPREGEALERQLRRGVEGGSLRTTTGNLREDIVAFLPTPNTKEHREIKTPEQIAELKKRSPGGYRNLREVVINEMPESEEVELLMTPLVDDSKNSGQNQTRRASLASQIVTLPAAEEEPLTLLPTILATEGTKMDTTQSIEDREAGGHQVALTNIARSGVDDSNVWGRYAPAIRRWERVTGRPAPAPTKPDGKEGAHRLSSLFTEWMMGLPEGWITACGLTRNEELKLAGNGVVPQQAELALRILIPTQLQQGAK